MPPGSVPGGSNGHLGNGQEGPGNNIMLPLEGIYHSEGPGGAEVKEEMTNLNYLLVGVV